MTTDDVQLDDDPALWLAAGLARLEHAESYEWQEGEAEEGEALTYDGLGARWGPTSISRSGRGSRSSWGSCEGVGANST